MQHFGMGGQGMHGAGMGMPGQGAPGMGGMGGMPGMGMGGQHGMPGMGGMGGQPGMGGMHGMGGMPGMHGMGGQPGQHAMHGQGAPGQHGMPGMHGMQMPGAAGMGMPGQGHMHQHPFLQQGQQARGPAAQNHHAVPAQPHIPEVPQKPMKQIEAEPKAPAGKKEWAESPLDNHHPAQRPAAPGMGMPGMHGMGMPGMGMPGMHGMQGHHMPHMQGHPGAAHGMPGMGMPGMPGMQHGMPAPAQAPQPKGEAVDPLIPPRDVSKMDLKAETPDLPAPAQPAHGMPGMHHHHHQQQMPGMPGMPQHGAHGMPMHGAQHMPGHPHQQMPGMPGMQQQQQQHPGHPGQMPGHPGAPKPEGVPQAGQMHGAHGMPGMPQGHPGHHGMQHPGQMQGMPGMQHAPQGHPMAAHPGMAPQQAQQQAPHGMQGKSAPQQAESLQDFVEKKQHMTMLPPAIPLAVYLPAGMSPQEPSNLAVVEKLLMCCGEPALPLEVCGKTQGFVKVTFKKIGGVHVALRVLNSGAASLAVPEGTPDNKRLDYCVSVEFESAIDKEVFPKAMKVLTEQGKMQVDKLDELEKRARTQVSAAWSEWCGVHMPKEEAQPAPAAANNDEYVTAADDALTDSARARKVTFGQTDIVDADTDLLENAVKSDADAAVAPPQAAVRERDSDREARRAEHAEKDEKDAAPQARDRIEASDRASRPAETDARDERDRQ